MDIKSDLELTAKLLRAESDAEPDGRDRSLRRQFEENYRPALIRSSMPDKTRLLFELEGLISRTSFFLSHPQLLGQTLAGVARFDDILFKRGLAPLQSITSINRMLAAELPCLLLRRSEKEILALNDLDCPIELTADEFDRTNRNLRRHGLDIRQWLKAFLLRRESQKYDRLTLVSLPPKSDLSSEFNRMLLSRLDAMIIFARERSPRFDQLKEFCDRKRLPTFIVTTRSTLDCFDASVTELELPSIFHELDRPRRNHLFASELRCLLSEVEKFYRERLKSFGEETQQFIGALIKIDRDELLSLAEQTEREAEILRAEQSQMRTAGEALLEAADEFESRLGASIDDETNLLRAETIESLCRLTFLSIDAKKFDRAEDCIRQLERAQFPRTYALEMLRDHARNRRLSSDRVERMRNQCDDELIRKIKLRLRSQLRFSDYDCMQIARDIRRLSTAEEFYWRGRWLDHSNAISGAIECYRKAAIKDYEPAVERLLELAKDNRGLLEWLAERLIPEANYRLGLEGDRAQLILAAARDHPSAIKLLANELISDDARTEDCLRLHQKILELEPNNEAVREIIGDLYARLGRERPAYGYWGRCTTASAQYKCGRLFQRGSEAFARDLKRAEEYFSAAAARGHEEAQFELEKVIAELAEEEKKSEREYDPSKDYASTFEELPPTPPPKQSGTRGVANTFRRLFAR